MKDEELRQELDQIFGTRGTSQEWRKDQIMQLIKVDREAAVKEAEKQGTVEQIYRQRRILIELLAFVNEEPAEVIKERYLGKSPTGTKFVSNRTYSGVETAIAQLNEVRDECSGANDEF